jgi:hypothetical protein
MEFSEVYRRLLVLGEMALARYRTASFVLGQWFINRSKPSKVKTQSGQWLNDQMIWWIYKEPNGTTGMRKIHCANSDQGTEVSEEFAEPREAMRANYASSLLTFVWRQLNSTERHSGRSRASVIADSRAPQSLASLGSTAPHWDALLHRSHRCQRLFATDPDIGRSSNQWEPCLLFRRRKSWRRNTIILK